MRDNGYFPEDQSLLRAVHAERSVGLHFGQRALLIGALEPINFIGTVLHTRHRESPFKRLTATAKVFETVFFGTKQQADHELRRVALMHSRVKGSVPESSEPEFAGRPYSAYDPDLMLWTLGCIADSGQALFEATVGRLSSQERERLWNDYRLFGQLFGMNDADMPATYSEYREWWNETLRSRRMYLTDHAREAGINSAFRIPFPDHGRLGLEVGGFLILGSVPDVVRRHYRFKWTRRQAAAHSALCASLRATHRVLPDRMHQGPNTRIFDTVERTELKWIEQGRARWVL